jgi:hypothetical protein
MASSKLDERLRSAFRAPGGSFDERQPARLALPIVATTGSGDQR